MTTFAVVSDLHLDTHKPKVVAQIIEQLISSLDNADYIILAGDLSTSGIIHKMSTWAELMAPIADRVIFVPGNHDFYNTTFVEFWNRIHEIGFAYILNNETITIDGLIIYGGTLWFDKPMVGYAGWCDYEWIEGNCKKEIYQSSAEFKCNMPQRADIVISHHIPTQRSIHARFLGSQFNCFYLNDCEELIRCVKPQYWINGHTHDPVHYQFNQYTKMICNPLGYPNENTGRYKTKYIEVN